MGKYLMCYITINKQGAFSIILKIVEHSAVLGCIFSIFGWKQISVYGQTE